ncbi:MAG: 4-alpha-glucanotransferase [Alphaproteobacteria bacterium]|nr:4-alpha-glucanotransferase [Alphaproteobacteria bacterium]
MQNTWEKLLEKIGVVKTYEDAAQNHKTYTADDETLRQIVNCLGFELKNIDESAQLLQKLENKRWQYTLEPIYVVRGGQKIFDAAVKIGEVDALTLSVLHNGQPIEVQYTQQIVETKQIGRHEYARVQFTVISDMAPEYYEIELTSGGNIAHSVLAVTPEKCYVPEVLTRQKLWGFAIQLYALTSARNWGVGDFTDLQNFALMCAKVGADVIGVNPLNVLFHDYPENASPYSSISRLFLNPIYIDVEKVAGYKPEYIDAATLDYVRQTTDIDYTAVYNLKMTALKKIFEKFVAKPQAREYQKFAKYCADAGSDLDNLATFQAIYSAYHDKVFGGWRGWKKELQNPYSAAVAEFKKTHEREILFFKFLQYIAESQLQEVYQTIKECGLKIGLYRDLPVGLCKDSAELWAGNDLFIKDCGAGAPPDVFFPTGQKWCLGAFNPYRLKAAAYRPFIKILRAAMQGAGALRIDHVMSLMRLYIIPDKSEDGTYVYYNFDDMLGIVALESYLNKCMVVGESIGNVPDGFIDKIHARGIYSLSVLWAERWNGGGDFKAPTDFPQSAFCSVGTHDMAPLKMRWFGYDIETMFKLKMLDEQERQNQYQGREDERRRLLGALDWAGVWPQDKPRQCDCLFGEGYPNGLTEAVEAYASESNSAVYLAQLEDIFGVEVLQNLPGTDRDKHPNWRRKLPVKIEDYAQNDDFNRAVGIIRQKRKTD